MFKKMENKNLINSYKGIDFPDILHIISSQWHAVKQWQIPDCITIGPESQLSHWDLLYSSLGISPHL